MLQVRFSYWQYYKYINTGNAIDDGDSMQTYASLKWTVYNTYVHDHIQQGLLDKITWKLTYAWLIL